ncbi:hypothetical protein GGR50DRAFT_696016 [Xylaria sp. CBS 124048]|nr:hypothetical protein GGR50DRAFT_696016 [Xylaria sp. CBS 124048]
MSAPVAQPTTAVSDVEHQAAQSRPSDAQPPTVPVADTPVTPLTVPTEEPRQVGSTGQNPFPQTQTYPVPWGQWTQPPHHPQQMMAGQPGQPPQIPFASWGPQQMAMPSVSSPLQQSSFPAVTPPYAQGPGQLPSWQTAWMWPQPYGWSQPMYPQQQMTQPPQQQQPPPPPASQSMGSQPTVPPTQPQVPNVQGFPPQAGTVAPHPAYMRLPSSAECGHFDGTSPAAQWLQVVRWEFHRVGVMSDSPSVCKIIEAIGMLCRGAAAAFLRKSPIAKDVIQRARTGMSMPTDLPLVEKALCEQFPELPDEDTVVTPLEELEALAQDSAETLPAYFTRAQVLLRRMNIKDAPILDIATQSGEACLLKSAISHFVSGLWDAELRTEAREKDADGKNTLTEAYETVKKAQQLLRKRQEIQRQQAQALRVQMLESLVAASTGVPATQALMQSFPNIVLPEDRAEIAEITAASSQAVMSRPHQAFDISRPEQFWKPAKSVMSGQAAPTAQQVAVIPSSKPQKNYSFADPASLPPRESSQNPIINGKEKIQPSTRACFRCGKRDHYKNQCSTPEGDCLLPWEQSWMRLLMMNRPQPAPSHPWQKTSSSGLPTVAVAASAEMSHSQPDHSHRYSPDWSAVHPDRMARMVAACATDVEGEIASAGALRAAGGLESNSCILSAGDEEDDTPEEELSSHVLYLSALLGEAVNRAAKKRKMGNGAGVSVESMLNPEPWRQPDQPSTSKPKQASTSKPTVRNETKDTGQRRPDPAPGPDPIFPIPDPDPGPRRQRRSRAPREIQGRLGEGPFDWKKLANAVEVKLSLMDLFQISPEGSAALKKMATRISAKAQAKARKMASFSKRHAKSNSATMDVAANSAATEYTTTRAWRVTPVIKYRSAGKTLTRTLPENSAQTDQGSDINIISDGAVQTLNLQRRQLSTIGVDKLFVKTSTGDSARVTEFVVMDLGVLSIWRGVWAIVRPKSLTGAHEGINLLLGLPWLWDVAAFIDIRSSSLWIGDRDEGEARVQIRGPLMVRSANHRICLESNGPTISLNPGAVVEELSEDRSASEDADDEEDSGEDELSTEDITDDNVTEETGTTEESTSEN